MDANQNALFDAVWNMARDGQYGKLGLYFGILYLPAVVAFLFDWRKAKKVDALYNARISDKDAEIKRLAASVKEFQNALLKAKRK